jgi:Phage integrase family
VCKVLKGIAALHPTTEKRAKPLQLVQLEQLVAWLDTRLTHASTSGDVRTYATHARDKALLLIGFWRGFRSDELSRMCVEHVEVETGRGMTVFLPRTKADRIQRGTTFKAPALSRMCPAAAFESWITASGLKQGPVFRRIDRWGNVGDEALHVSSFVPLLRALFRAAELPAPDSYSSHSLRRGFATWANANQWDLKMLMEYVGWKDVRSAMRYIDAADPFAQHRIESALSVAAPPTPPHPPTIKPVVPSALPPVVPGRSRYGQPPLFGWGRLNLVRVLTQDFPHRLHHFSMHLHRELLVSGWQLAHHRTTAHHPAVHHVAHHHGMHGVLRTCLGAFGAPARAGCCAQPADPRQGKRERCSHD